MIRLLFCGGMRRGAPTVFVWSVVFFCGGTAALGADWPHWRGADYDGISRETDWRSDGMTVLWRVNVGTGFSSVAVSGGRVYTLGNDGTKGVDPNTHRDTVNCLNAAILSEAEKQVCVETEIHFGVQFSDCFICRLFPKSCHLVKAGSKIQHRPPGSHNRNTN